MPSMPPNDDQFADLFSKLPAPSERAGRRTTMEETGPTATPLPAAAPTGPVDATGAPMSRRAAREASRRAGTDSAPQQPDAAPAAPDSVESGGPRRGTAADYPIEAAAAAADPGAPAPARADAPNTTLDALFTEDQARHEREAKHDRDRRKSRIAAWSVFGVVLALIGGLVFGGVWVWNTYEEPIREFMGWTEPKDYEEGLAEGETTVSIVSGDTGATISETLYDAGVTKTSGAFYDYLIDTGQNPTFVPGVFALQQKMSSAAALEALLDPANKRENTAQLREGLTVEQSLPLLAEGIGLPLEDFVAAVADPAAYGVAADDLEGWLFPATYRFDDGVTAPQVIQTLVDRTVQSLDEAGVPEAQRHEILTIASIIEREARFEDDFFKVSRVIQNRLDPSNDETGGLLQMDSTAQYGYGEMHDGTVSSSAEALEDDNPWNTYLHAGLPKGPIANPGDLAIKAAMEPAEGPWQYFVTVNPSAGETEFAVTYAEHLQLVEKWDQWCRDNPDNGDC